MSKKTPLFSLLIVNPHPMELNLGPLEIILKKWRTLATLSALP